MPKTITKTLTFRDTSILPVLFGTHNAHITYVEEKLGITIHDKGNVLTFAGDPAAVKKAVKVFKDLRKKIEKNQGAGKADIDAALRFMNNTSPNTHKAKPTMSSMTIKTKKKDITARSPNQSEYIGLIKNNELVFGLGPAGTGKTYLAVAMGVSMYLEGKVERLIFCRPAVEAGENLGFLPGDMKDKVDPYLRPIYDALHDMLPMDFVAKKIEAGDIEIAPLAFMRGRTLSRAFVILDEAQNTTSVQMKMLLTRLGESSRMVITGDLSQTDLPKHIKSGLRDAVETLDGIDGIGFLKFAKEDVIRHPLVSKIVHAYDQRQD